MLGWETEEMGISEYRISSKVSPASIGETLGSEIEEKSSIEELK